MRRLFVIGFLLVMVWSTVFVSREWDLAADVTGRSTAGCIRNDHVAYEGSVVGIASFRSQFRLIIEGTAIVHWRWELSSGAVTASRYYRGPGTFWKSTTSPTGGIEPVYMQPGSSGTIRLVAIFLDNSAYTGCYRMDQIIVRTTAFAPSDPVTPPAGGGGGIATPTPTPTPAPGEPTPSPVPTSPPCSTELGAGETEDSCPPPDGYCYAYGPPTPDGWPIVECEAEETPSPTPTATAPPDISSGVICSWSSPWDSGCSGSVSLTSLDGGGIEAGDIVRVYIHDNVLANSVSWDRWSSAQLPSVESHPVVHFCSNASGGVGNATPSGPYPGGVGTHTTICGDWESTHTAPVVPSITISCSGNAQHPANGNCTADIWVTKAGAPTPTPTTPPVSTPSPTPTPPPGWATPQPGQPGTGTGFDTGTVTDVPGSGNEPIYPAPSGTGSGSGVTECMADGMTPVEDKIGYIAPVAVPEGPSLGQVVAGQTSLLPPFNILVGTVVWVGTNVTIASKQAEQIPVHMWNRGVDAVIPGACVGDIMETRVAEFLTIEPFATYVALEAELQAALAEGAPVMPEFCIPLPGGGEACLPLGEWASVIAPYRNAAAVLVWLLAALGIRNVVLQSFKVARANVQIDNAIGPKP